RHQVHPAPRWHEPRRLHGAVPPGGAHHRAARSSREHRADLRCRSRELSPVPRHGVPRRSVAREAAPAGPDRRADRAPGDDRGRDADTAADVWAMGAILYRLLADAPAFDAASLTALSSRVLSGEPPPPLVPRCPEAPAEVCALVERMLRCERAERPSVSEVLAV